MINSLHRRKPTADVCWVVCVGDVCWVVSPCVVGSVWVCVRRGAVCVGRRWCVLLEVCVCVCSAGGVGLCVLGDGQNKNKCLLSKGKSVMRQIDEVSIMDRKGELGTAREG